MSTPPKSPPTSQGGLPTPPKSPPTHQGGLPTPPKSPPTHQGGLQPTAGDDGRFFAVLAYVLPVIGGVVGLLADGGNPLTRSHARQSIGAVLALILSFLVWVVGGYIISLIPIAGPILAIALFSLVIAMAAFMIANWLVNLVLALRGLERTIPVANRIVVRLFGAEAAATQSA